MPQIDPGIDLVAGLEMLLVVNADDPYVRDVLKQRTHRVDRRTPHRLLYFVQFHHVVKLAYMVKLVKRDFGRTPLSANC